MRIYLLGIFCFYRISSVNSCMSDGKISGPRGLNPPPPPYSPRVGSEASTPEGAFGRHKVSARNPGIGGGIKTGIVCFDEAMKDILGSLSRMGARMVDLLDKLEIKLAKPPRELDYKALEDMQVKLEMEGASLSHLRTRIEKMRKGFKPGSSEFTALSGLKRMSYLMLNSKQDLEKVVDKVAARFESCRAGGNPSANAEPLTVRDLGVLSELREIYACLTYLPKEVKPGELAQLAEKAYGLRNQIENEILAGEPFHGNDVFLDDIEKGARTKGRKPDFKHRLMQRMISGYEHAGFMHSDFKNLGGAPVLSEFYGDTISVEKADSLSALSMALTKKQLRFQPDACIGYRARELGIGVDEIDRAFSLNLAQVADNTHSWEGIWNSDKRRTKIGLTDFMKAEFAGVDLLKGHGHSSPADWDRLVSLFTGEPFGSCPGGVALPKDMACSEYTYISITVALILTNAQLAEEKGVPGEWVLGISPDGDQNPHSVHPELLDKLLTVDGLFQEVKNPFLAKLLGEEG